MHPYPPHLASFDYLGKYTYFLTFNTFDRTPILAQDEPIGLVKAQFLRAAHEHRFELTAYCFMPDHVHLLVRGVEDDSDCRAFIKAADG
jgi:REP element-mobilizing transposase RayT